jgi:hypothetical protein
MALGAAIIDDSDVGKVCRLPARLPSTAASTAAANVSKHQAISHAN